MAFSPADELRALYAERREQIIDGLFTFLRFPSVSADPAQHQGMSDCCEWLCRHLREIGFVVVQWETTGYPTIFAEWNKAGPSAPTVMIYNHYDVQPVDPLDAWTTPPFEPAIRDGNVYARGAQDNKGQCWYAISALQALLESHGSLPVNVKLIIEGEEEIASIGLGKILESRRTELAADHLIVLDCGIPSAETPAVTLGIRGFVGIEIELTGSKFDLHSGSHGGLAYNPNHAMVELLAKLRGPDGTVAVPGFYDEVLELGEEERTILSIEFDADRYFKEFGVASLGGETRFTPNERRWARPCLDIISMWGGHCDAGIKTIIPAQSTARITARLVPNQDPHIIAERLSDFIRKNCPAGFELSLKKWPGVGIPVRTPASAPIVQATAQAYSEACNKECKFILEGWSVPVVSDLARVSGAAVALAGFELTTDAIHAPNEHFGLDRLELGFIMTARALQIVGNAAA